MKKQLQIHGVRKPKRAIWLVQIFLFAALASFGTSAAYAQSVSGSVKDESGEALPGVNVLEKGTTNGTTTDADGKYMIKLQDDNGILSFSFIGFTTQEVQANGRTLLDVTMLPDIESLDEVVVVGYGTQREREVTGAIGSITSKDISKVVVTGLDQALQGKIAGVQVTQNSGEPGGNVSVRIRGVGSINGSNEPLYIVDGVPYGNLNSINPNDIERIDVLKDAASAAIYGSRGTNGVVIITTKRAKAGKTTVTFDAYVGVQNAYRKLDLLDGKQFATLANQNITTANAERTARGLPADQLLKVNPAWSNPATVPNIDWQDAVLQSAPIQNYNINISGGTDKSRTLLSIGYFDQNGITNPSNFKRYTARLNTDYDLTKKLKVGVTLNGSFEEKNSVISVDGTNTGNFGALTSSARMHPTALVKTDRNGFFGLNTDGTYNTDSTYYGYEGYSFPSKNSGLGGANSYLPGGLSNTPYLYNESKKNIGKSQQLLAAAFVEYEVITGLKIRSAMNFTVGNTYGTDFQRESPEEIQARGNNPTISGFSENSSGSTQWNWVNTLSYTKSIEDHNMSVIVGTDALKGAFRNTYVNTYDVPPSQQYINASNFNTRNVFGNPGDYTLVSYFGRVTYDFKGKYLFNANVRRDGSSNFGPQNKYGTFPSASVGWRISEEAFMQNISVINDFKLRGSYGVVGNQNVGQFRYLSTFGNDGGNRQYTLGTGQVAVNAVYPNNFGNPGIRWEKSTQANIGLDATFLNDKFTLTTDYYIKKISDMLGDFPVPYYTGITGGTITRNGFSMENRGLEITLGYNQQIGEVKFSINGNFTTLKNEVTKLTDNTKGFIARDISAGGGDGSAITRTAVGDRIGAFYGYIEDGIIQNAAELAASGMDLSITKVGDRKYKDIDGNRKIDTNDRVLIGNGLPKYTYGFSLNTEYKGFDLSVLLNGQAGVEIANQTRYWLYNMRYDIIQGGITNVSSDLLNSWNGEGSSNELPRNSYDASPNNRLFSTFNIENGAFLRVRNVQLGFTIPQEIVKKAGMSRARIFIAAQNLFTFTKYTGYDPEVGSINQNVLQTGVDFGRYPVSRMFTGGVNIQF
jgi:TonB-dependent starch-binding outer membrane protein SusC